LADGLYASNLILLTILSVRKKCGAGVDDVKYAKVLCPVTESMYEHELFHHDLRGLELVKMMWAV